MRRSKEGLPLLFHLNVLVPVPGRAGAEPGVDEAVEIAVEHALGVARADPGAHVLHHLVGLEDVAADLAPPPDFTLLAVELFHLAALLVEPALIQAGLE